MGDSIWQMIAALPLDQVSRVDVAFEGDWNSAVKTVWTRQGGWTGDWPLVVEHPQYPPSVELYFESSWMGFRCYVEREGIKVLDVARLERVVAMVAGGSIPRRD